MKDEDIKLPDSVGVNLLTAWQIRRIQEYALEAVRLNLPQPKTSEPEPFDLARAMDGEPIVTRDGRKARFVAHVPEVEDYKVMALVEGSNVVDLFTEGGCFSIGSPARKTDLFMAPKPKRTVWVNVWENGFGNLVSSCHDTKVKALCCAQNVVTTEFIKKAHPIEIDA